MLVELVPSIGVRRRFPDRRRALRPPPGDWRRVVLNRHLVDWAALEARAPTAGLTSRDRADVRGQRADHRVRRVAAGRRRRRRRGHRLGQRLVGPRSPRRSTRWRPVRPGAGAPQPREPRLRARQQPRPRARAPATSWSSSTTTPRSRPAGWPRCATALEDPEVLGAQPLLLYPSGVDPVGRGRVPDVRRAAAQLPPGFPAEDAYGVDGLRFHALTGAALALRYADAVALRGFDPVFTNGMEDVDLCHRLAAQRPTATSGSSTAVPVVHHESRTPGRYDKHLANRAVYLDRWQRVRRAPRRRRALGRPRAAGGRPRGRAGPARRAAAAAGSRGRCWSARPGSRSPRTPAALGDQEPRARRTRRRALGRHPLRRRRWPRRCATTARRSSSTGGPSGTGPPAATTTSCSCCAGWSATTRAPSRCRCSG